MLVLAAVIIPGAAASQFVDFLPPGSTFTLKADGAGRAMLYYSKPNGARHVLVQGAINARFPSRTVTQVHFNLDYSGGFKTTGKALWKTFQDGCSAYDGPALPKAVATCKAPDGSYWALQEWQVALPDLGFTPWTARQRSFELHVSHWTGPITELEAHADWVYGGRFHEVFGRASYKDHAIYGFQSTNRGAPTDNYGRLIYLDTLDSRYGPGWSRENSFLPHRPTGVYCYGFFKHNPNVGGYAKPPGYKGGVRGPGNGKSYRLTITGPGVTPDVQTVVDGLSNYNRQDATKVAYERQQNQLLDQLAAGGRQCHHH